MDTHSKGNGAEAAVIHAFEVAGVRVFVPFGGGVPCDLVAAVGDRLLRVQVKSGRVRSDCVRFNTCSTDHGRGRLDYRGRAEVIAVYVAELGRVFVIPVDDCPSYTGVLRLAPPRNNQRRRIRMAEDHSFETWVESLLAAT